MQGSTEEKKDAEAEGLAQLIPDIQETAKLLQQVVQKFRKQKAVHTKSMEGTGKEPESEAASLSPEERYLASMKPLQFGKRCHVSEFLAGVGKWIGSLHKLSRRRRHQQRKKKRIALDYQKYNFARAAHFLIHFFGIAARLRRKNA